MSLILIKNPTSTFTLSSQWTDFVNREDHSNVGVGTSIPIFRLTNWDTGTARPLVAEGAIIEVGGSLYQADSDTALVDDTGLVDGLCFIKMVPGTGTPDPGTVVPTLTSDTMPAFDAEQGGWYDGSDKFLPMLITRSGSGTSYVNKGEYVDQNQRIIQYIDGGTYMAGAAQVGGALTVGAGATFNGAISGITSLACSTINTGQGDNELYDMNQNVLTSSSPTFAAVTSGSSSLKWKRFSGTLDGSGEAVITHGVGSGNIVGASSSIATAVNGYIIGNYSPASQYVTIIAESSTTISILTSGGSLFNSRPYTCVVFYI